MVVAPTVTDAATVATMWRTLTCTAWKQTNKIAWWCRDPRIRCSLLRCVNKTTHAAVGGKSAVEIDVKDPVAAIAMPVAEDVVPDPDGYASRVRVRSFVATLPQDVAAKLFRYRAARNRGSVLQVCQKRGM